MFIAPAMAFHAVFTVVDPFFNVFRADLGAGVFMTAVASVVSMIIVDVTGYTIGVMVPVVMVCRSRRFSGSAACQAVR